MEIIELRAFFALPHACFNFISGHAVGDKEIASTGSHGELHPLGIGFGPMTKSVIAVGAPLAVRVLLN